MDMVSETALFYYFFATFLLRIRLFTFSARLKWLVRLPNRRTSANGGRFLCCRLTEDSQQHDDLGRGGG